MGAGMSTLLTDCDIRQIKSSCSFNEKEIKRLYERFVKLDKDKTGTLSAEELLAIPEFAMNPLASRLVTILLYDPSSPTKQRELDFNGFVAFLSTFHPESPIEKKLQLAFKVFNASGDGLIKREEVMTLLKVMTGNHLNEQQVNALLEQTVPNPLDFNAFCAHFGPQFVQTKMSIKL